MPFGPSFARLVVLAAAFEQHAATAGRRGSNNATPGYGVAALLILR
jgi:hypothetical protein